MSCIVQESILKIFFKSSLLRVSDIFILFYFIFPMTLITVRDETKGIRKML